MHREQRDFCEQVKRIFPSMFKEKKVLDVGSLDVNGTNRYLFEECKYTGLDLGEGKNVNVVCPGHLYNELDGSFDTIISTECFEHDIHFPETLKNIIRLLRSGGLFLFTCGTIGRAEHGTSKTDSVDSPFTSKIKNWCNYYGVVTENQVRNIIEMDKIFVLYKFDVNPIFCPGDIRFWGIKK